MNLKAPETFYFGMCQNGNDEEIGTLNVISVTGSLELEDLKGFGTLTTREVPRPLKPHHLQFWHFPISAVSDSFQWEQALTVSYLSSLLHFPISKGSDTFQFWHFPVRAVFDTFYVIMTLSNLGRLWHFLILTLSKLGGFWHFPISEGSNIFRFWHFLTALTMKRAQSWPWNRDDLRTSKERQWNGLDKKRGGLEFQIQEISNGSFPNPMQLLIVLGLFLVNEINSWN